jgi:DNA gyrase subunit A
VRCQRFLKGEDRLVFAWVGAYPARPEDEEGRALALPALDDRRDGSGAPLAKSIWRIGG